MFLKKHKANKRLLFNKFFIDPWSSIIVKKTFRNRTTQRFFQFFTRYIVGRGFSYLHKKDFYRFSRRGGRFSKKKFKIWKKRKFKRKARLPQPDYKHHWQIKPKLVRTATAYRGFILLHLKNYLRTKEMIYGPEKTLVRKWLKNVQRKNIKKILRKYSKHRPFARKYHYLRRKNDYIVTQLMDLVFQQYHYGFSSLSSFKSYIKMYAGREFTSRTTTNLGIEGMFANQLARTGLVANVRAAYLLIRTGAVKLNGCIIKNPRKMLSIGDSFQIVYPFSSLLLRDYIRRLKLRQVFFNVPRYYEYNLKLLLFNIIRRPTRRERRLMSYYPFMKNELTWGAVKYFKWGK